MSYHLLNKKLLQLKSKLVKLVQNDLNFCHLKVVFQSPYKPRTLFRFKDTLDKKILSDLVYRFSCSSCKRDKPVLNRTVI